MRAPAPAWRGIRALCVCLVLTLSLAIAPVGLALKHGPGAVAAETDHRAFHADTGQEHDIAGPDHHDSSDHDHVGAALLVSAGVEFHPPPDRTLRPDPLDAAGTIRDGPRRPLRLTLI